jgi:hypothetical protein
MACAARRSRAVGRGGPPLAPPGAPLDIAAFFPGGGISPLEACSLVAAWSTSSPASDPQGFPRTVPASMARQNRPDLFLAAPDLPLTVPLRLRDAFRGDLPGRLFQRSPEAAAQLLAAVAIYRIDRGLNQGPVFLQDRQVQLMSLLASHELLARCRALHLAH